jgi:hypothetical protein
MIGRPVSEPRTEAPGRGGRGLIDALLSEAPRSTLLASILEAKEHDELTAGCAPHERHARGRAVALGDDVRFRSPFAEYEGRDTIARLFTVMPAVFDDLALVRELRGDDREVAAVLRGRIGDEPVDVIVDERYAVDGRVSEAMLVTRPLAATKAAITRMGALLESDGS